MQVIATDVAVSVSVCLSVCVSGTTVDCAKTAEMIEMSLGGQTRVCGPKEPCIKWTKCGPDSPREGKADVPKQHTRLTSAFSAAMGDNTAMRPCTKLLWTLVSCLHGFIRNFIVRS